MAISEQKLEANRANAKRSTGPRTARGKAVVARNALTHGLTARGALLPREGVRAYKLFAQRIFDELQPDGVLQEELAAEIVNLSWKLRRVPGAESMLMKEQHSQVNGYDMSLPPTRVLSNMILHKKAYDGSPDSPLWLLDRYATRIERSRANALRMLLTLQKRRRERGEEVDEDEDSDVSGDPVAAIDDAPAQNKATAESAPDDAQVIVSTSDAILDAPPVGAKDVQNKATG